MKTINNYITEKLVFNKHTKAKHIYNYYPKDWMDLKKLVKDLVEERGDDADLNDIDTSNITNMTGLFEESKFNGDISKWNVSKVKSMKFMFRLSEFDGDISKWNVSNVTDMWSMFYGSKFTGKKGDISDWDVSKVTDMQFMFERSPLENNPPKWYRN